MIFEFIVLMVLAVLCAIGVYDIFTGRSLSKTRNTKPVEQQDTIDNINVDDFCKKYNEHAFDGFNAEDYNGGISIMDFGQIKFPLPVPEKDKKWAMRWHDTPSGELLPELVQVSVSEPNSAWQEGYPKYK